jgi:DNA-binding CsgD family transcriptional regulator
MNKTHNPTPHTSLSHQQGYIGQRPALGLSQESGQLLAHALDEIACGVIIVDGQGHVQHCNLAGQMILQRGQLLSSEQATLQAVESADAPALAEALAKAMQGKRSMLNLGKLAQSTVAVVPLDRAERWGSAEPVGQSASSGANSSTPSTRIALIFSRTGMCETLMMSFFSRAYQLTRSEEQILSLICVGHTAPEMAKQLRVGEATVRTHIRSICQKTHSHGIREVVKRLALLPPLMAAVMPGAFA